MLLAPVVAWADKQIEASPPNRFSTREITMDQGEKLVFKNGDTVSHDVTASAAGPDGKPLFRTPIVNAGKEAFVDGSQYLTEGHYDFLCSLHPSMKGTLHVTGNGTPEQRPAPATPESKPADTTRPSLKVQVVSRSAQVARARHALLVRVQVSELTHVALRAVARPKAGGPLVTVARGQLHSATGVKRMRLKLTAAGQEALRRDRSLAVVVTGWAIDRSGNKSRIANHGRTLTP